MIRSRLFFYFMLTLAMMTWGVSWASGKFLAGREAPEILLFFRFLFTFISLIPLVYIFEKNFKLNKNAIKFIVLGGIFMSGYNYLFFMGLHNGLAGAGGVLVTTMNPVLTFIIASGINRYKPVKKEIAGLLIGIAGGMIMIHIWQVSWADLIHSGNLYLLGASFTWAFMTLTSQYSGKSIPILKFTMYVHAVAAAISFIPASTSSWSTVFNQPSFFWWNILYLSIISTSFGTTIYFAASRSLGSKAASSFIFIVPLTALFSGVIFLKETPGLYIIFGGALSLTAVYLLNFKKDKIKGLSLSPNAE
ncbi:MAG: DMT family transporter [Spirochaetia bacterium]|nr:DMT family transporter [Spirochaetia bacterium]